MGRGGPRLLGLIALLALPALAPACGGGGGGGGSPTEPVPTATPQPTPTPGGGPGITFSAASSGPGVVLAQGAASTAAALTVEVRAAQVTSLYALVFDLDYPAAALRYQSAAAGPFLGSAGQISTQVVESASGHLVVGVTRLGSVAGVDGSGVVLQLVFTPVANGGGPFAFSRNTAYRADGTTMNVPWAGGSVTVVR